LNDLAVSAGGFVLVSFCYVLLCWVLEFVPLHGRSKDVNDFFTIETIWLQRLYILFFIELGSRRVHMAGCTPESERALGHQAGKTPVVDVGGARRADSVSDS
jgi:hypothetical protein